ncbi:hypothetical protein D3Z47_02085 [Lachnospiraceae bacterium]|nr:hypothetical protein [Lachnospiraceae bacterium]
MSYNRINAEDGPKNIILENLSITKDEASAVLERRWLVCYMLYDWNYHRAEYAFAANEMERFQKTIKALNGHTYAVSELDQKLTKAYNRALMEDIEAFIKQHMKVWPADRTVVELELAKAEAEMFQC